MKLLLLPPLLCGAALAAAAAAEGQRSSQPSPHGGYYVNNEDLRDINSIDCLKRKQKDPDASCVPRQRGPEWPDVPSWGVFRKVKDLPEPRTRIVTTTLPTDVPEVETPEREGDRPPMSIATFPHWEDEACHSEGAYLCDPDQLLNKTQRQDLADGLEAFRKDSEIKCGQLDSLLAGEDQATYEHFKLGVAVLGRDWPRSEIDPVALQKLGTMIMVRWGLISYYNGVQYDWGTRCPNAAVLIFVPRYNEVYLSAPSCEFICSERGGPEVMNAAMLAMRDDGLAEAVRVGIEQVERIVAVSTPLSLEKPFKRISRRSAGGDWLVKNAELRDTIWVVVQRVALASFVVCSVIAGVMFGVYNLVPSPPEVRLKVQQTT